MLSYPRTERIKLPLGRFALVGRRAEPCHAYDLAGGSATINSNSCGIKAGDSAEKLAWLRRECLASIGLALDIAGALMLWRYGLSEDRRRGGRQRFLLEQIDEAEAAKVRHYDRLSLLAITLLVAGFALQLVSNQL